MNIKSSHQRSTCPACGSKDLHTQGLDQICLDCDWTNSKLLVDLGQMDRIVEAAHRQFVDPLSFDDLRKIEITDESPQEQTLSFSKPEPSRLSMRSFFAGFLRSKSHLHFEDWERLETRRSPQSIRADARREGLL